MNNRQHENQAGEGAERCPFCGGTGTLTPKRQKRPNVRAADMARLEEAGWAAMKPGRQEGLTERAAWALRAYAGGGGKVMPALRSMLRDLRRGVCVPGIGTWRDIWTAQRPGEPVPDGCPRGWLTARWLYGGVCRAYRRLENAQLSTLKQ